MNSLVTKAAVPMAPSLVQVSRLEPNICSSPDERSDSHASQNAVLQAGEASTSRIRLCSTILLRPHWPRLLSCAALSGRTRQCDRQSKCSTWLRVCRSKHSLLGIFSHLFSIFLKESLYFATQCKTHPHPGIGFHHEF